MSITTTSALVVVISALFSLAFFADKELSARSDACQAKGGILLKSSDGRVCVQAKVV